MSRRVVALLSCSLAACQHAPVAARGADDFAKSVTITDVGTLVEAINSGQVKRLPDAFPKHLDADSFDAAYYFPKMLQGLGALHFEFKRGAEEEWRPLVEDAESLTPEELKEKGWAWKWVDRIAKSQGRSGGEPSRHYILEPWTEEQSNHGRVCGVTVLDGGSAILFVEFW